ncbi:ATP-grasp superfamily (LysX) (PDB:1GLV) [Commensalibacter communis]|uniref:Glutathione synthetase n=1 Tax=Commensalibacter communis TaxID=2972786 RepID=A0A9W4TNM2_9PROT|nr:glutathione synthase [Commensalibacter communis]CAI3922477.1 ATP-grasp superfamily (LysX) (PDB:1GLV) [Commensalibacter communis]CAI3922844.1 ATP-grasp superfamily (LysX) (PDB:1GLV) [Commensalibacter communis]CAI3934913.1 ATP-grasp superfamily (LysX) (PDB:1GLV) [Commensalibacter communis]CAI3944546.1 ATP-grasp superfamily (LysX) (PDB:1GLV) [Commensalibacter communis]CAI3947922.1 ATP-grasp superfamily (LysX) (PDB:1GLV) [Commensalibacter communis]
MLKIAVQMDPLETININGDSTFALMLEAQARKYELFVYSVDTLSLESDSVSKKITARGRDVTVQRVQNNHVQYGEEKTVELKYFDVLLMRQDPPFDMGYITATHLLEQIHGVGKDKVFVVNNPTSVRNAPEKIFATLWPEIMPPTLITRDVKAIREFRAEYKDIIIKPLFGNGGIGVFRIREDDENLNSLLEMQFAASREPLMIQRYEPAVRLGDKRIILVEGQPIGAINRVPQKGDLRSNMHVGGIAEKIDLTPRDKEICELIGPALKEQGLLFVGIDVLGDYLTEINVTSPTGLQELDRFNNINSAGIVWDAIETYLK